jgi:RHS repeat-associated protein
MPYGEVWIEQGKDDVGKTPFRFTGKELDAETGLYYYGARYMDPRTARWISADPALESYLPSAPVSDAARRRNGSLPGMGGVFNPVNLAVFTYAANNPVKYVDANGLDVSNPGRDEANLLCSRVTDGSIPALPLEGPCYMASLQGIAETYAGRNMTTEQKTESVSSLVNSSAMLGDFRVIDSQAVIVDTLARLGVDASQLNIRIALPGDASYSDVKAEATGSLRHVGRRDGTDGAFHWQQGDKVGAFVWDPISGSDDGGRVNYEDEARYVMIAKKEDE